MCWVPNWHLQARLNWKHPWYSVGGCEIVNTRECEKCFVLFNCDPNEFLHCFITVVETWIHLNIPDTKQRSEQKLSSSESTPKKAKVGMSAKKVMTTAFRIQYNPNRLPWKWNNSQWWILYHCIGLVQGRCEEQTTAFGEGDDESVLPSRHCKSAHVCSCYGKI